MPSVTKQVAKPGPKKKGGSVLDRISDIDVEGGIKLNIYGETATGKTTFWATFPGPILAMICSGGVGTGELRSINTPEYLRKIKQVSIEKSGEVMELARHFGARNDYKTLVLDHATGLQHMVLAEVLGIPQDELPAQLGWGTASQQQWGTVATQMKEILRSLLNTSLNVVIVAQQRSFESYNDNPSAAGEDDLVTIPYIASALSPSVVGWLNPACDYICQTFKRPKTETVEVKIGDKKMKQERRTKGVDYCLMMAPHALVTTKVRVPKGQAVPEYLVNPTYEKLIKVING